MDSVATKQVMESLAEINSVDKKTVIMITHNAAQLSYCHRVFYLKDGKLERVVPNPEKKQIAKVDKQRILVTEMDQLSKMFPYDSPISLKVKSIVNYLTQDLTFDQLQRLEEITTLIVERKIDGSKYQKILAKKFNDGGIEVSSSLAMCMSAKVEKMLKQAEDARRFRRRFLTNNFFSREHILVKNLTRHVIEEGKDEFTPVQKRRIKEIVYKRIAGLISKQEFRQSLQNSLDSGGVGATKASAKKLMVFFEKILIQASETKGHGR